MRLVLQYNLSDGCTYSCTETTPVEYDSPEALLVDFMDLAERAFVSAAPMLFCGEEMDASRFYEAVSADFARQHPDIRLLKAHGHQYLPVPPSVMTLDEWFATGLKAHA